MCFGFLFNETASTEIYTLSLHDALPIYARGGRQPDRDEQPQEATPYGRALDVAIPPRDGQREQRNYGDERRAGHVADRKSTRLNSSHANISHAVFCLKTEKADRSGRYGG